MAEHIDTYQFHLTGWHGSWTLWGRQFEGQAAVDYYNDWKDVKGFPYFNGYVLQTPLHADGECEAHRPKDGPLEPLQAEVSDG